MKQTNLDAVDGEALESILELKRLGFDVKAMLGEMLRQHEAGVDIFSKESINSVRAIGRGEG